jgi:hypothetical protein
MHIQGIRSDNEPGGFENATHNTCPKLTYAKINLTQLQFLFN